MFAMTLLPHQASARALLLALLLAAAAVPVQARGGGAAGPGGPGGAGSQRYGIGYQSRMSTLGTERLRPTPSPRAGPEVTPGWTLMTEREQAEHRERMEAMRSHEACTAFVEQHRAQMAARAKERGGQALAPTRRDACADLKP